MTLRGFEPPTRKLSTYVLCQLGYRAIAARYVLHTVLIHTSLRITRTDGLFGETRLRNLYSCCAEPVRIELTGLLHRTNLANSLLTIRIGSIVCVIA